MTSYHRPGAYAVNFGLDTDNVLKVGGWSMGGVAYTIIHSGNIANFNKYASVPYEYYESFRKHLELQRWQRTKWFNQSASRHSYF